MAEHSINTAAIDNCFMLTEAFLLTGRPIMSLACF